MRWMTLAHIHLDRVAAPWLITRFVDPDAEFSYLEWGLDGELPGSELAAQVPAGTTPVGIPGVTLGLHDSDGSCFAKVLRHHGLEDPALWRMERLVSAGVRHAFGQPPAADETAEESMLGAALDELGTALGVAFDDAEHLERALGLYDAVYTLCQIRELSPDTLAGAPRLPPLRTPYLREAIGRA
jgi:hypothetical protein